MTQMFKPPRLRVRRSTAKKMLDTSTSTLKRLEDRGLLTPFRDPEGKFVYYAAAEVEALGRGDGYDREEGAKRWRPHDADGAPVPPPVRKRRARS